MTDNRTLKSSLLNPLTIFIGLCSIVFTVLLWGEPFGTIFSLLFAPFLIDYGSGLDATGEWCIANIDWCFSSSMNSVYFMISFLSSMMIVVFLIALGTIKKGMAKTIVCTAGIIFSSLHYAFVAAFYIASGLH